MADYDIVSAVGSSLVRYLQHCFSHQQPVSTAQTRVLLARTEDLNEGLSPLINPPCLSLFLYRVGYNQTIRASWSCVAHAKGRSMVPLDFHFLLIPWGSNADQEYRIAGRTIQCFEDNPILSGPMLDPLTNWSDNENIQICIENVSTEDLMRTFGSLPINYKLCIPYLVKIVVLEGRRTDDLRETVHTV